MCSFAVEKELFTAKERKEHKEMLFLLRSLRSLAVEKGLFTAKERTHAVQCSRRTQRNAFSFAIYVVSRGKFREGE